MCHTSIPHTQASAIEKMTYSEPQRRPSAEHILDSCWFGELGETVKQDPTHITKT